MGLGLNFYVNALAALGSDLYAVGSFNRATNSSGAAIYCPDIVKWNGNAWFAVAFSDARYAVAVSGNTLYAGGGSYDSISKWDGSSWTRLGTRVEGTVFAMAASGNDLYVGGSFTGISTSATTAKNVAKWDGGKWTALGVGLNGKVNALAVLGNDLYVGGNFTMAGGEPANRMAKWDGSTWSPLGSGMNSNVHALTLSSSNLYAGGAFTVAGGKVSGYLAKAIVPVPPPQITVAASGSQIIIYWPPSYYTAVLESSPVLGVGAQWTNVPSSGNSATLPISPGNQFFRLRIP